MTGMCGVGALRLERPPSDTEHTREHEPCPVCGHRALDHRACKVICSHCRTIVQSCADL
jgi:hypothetical protein